MIYMNDICMTDKMYCENFIKFENQGHLQRWEEALYINPTYVNYLTREPRLDGSTDA